MRAHTKRRTVLKALGASGLAAATGVLGTAGATQQQTYTIGSAVSNSGDLAVYGQRHNRGMDLALEEINAEGVRDGTLEVSREDTASAPQTGVSAAQALVNQEGVPLLLGAVSSGVTVSIARSVTIPNQVVQVSPHSTSPELTTLEDDGYVLRTAPSDAFQGAAMARLALDNDISRASIVLVNNDYGRGFADVLQQRFEDGGGTVTNTVPYNSGQASYRPQLNQAMEGDPEAIMFVAYPESFTTMARQAFEMGIKDQVRYLGGESTLAEPIRENVPARALDGMIGTTPSPPTESDAYQRFSDAFSEAYDAEPTVWSAYSYDATMLAALAIQAADEFSGTALRDAIYPLSRPDDAGATTTTETETATATTETTTGTETATAGAGVSTFADAKAAIEAGEDVNYEGVSGSVDLDEVGDVPGTYRWWEFTDGDYQLREFIDVER